MKIKICGLFREQDIEYVNEARPDYIGFVFAPSRREVSPSLAERLRRRLAEGITAVGVFVNAPVEEIAALYRNGVISAAQLHGNEDGEYIARLKKISVTNRTGIGQDPIQIIKTIQSFELEQMSGSTANDATGAAVHADYCLIDSGAGSGKAFNWKLLESGSAYREWIDAVGKLWFLAGGINQDNIEEAMAFNPFAVDISGGAETDGVKDREKIVQLIRIVRKISEPDRGIR